MVTVTRVGTSKTSKAVDTILVIDFGGQYANLIGRQIRSDHVRSMVVSAGITLEEVEKRVVEDGVKGIVLSGGPASIYDEDAPKMDPRIVDIGLPLLGICYGHQLIAQYLGGVVERSAKQEYGHAKAHIDTRSGIFKDMAEDEDVWMSHGDSVLELPEGYEAMAHTENCTIAAFGNPETHIYGMQWHPEVVHTVHGEAVIEDFLLDVCRCKQEWDPERDVNQYVDEIREIVGGSRMVGAVSGGVDSMTAATMAGKALGSRFTAVFVDNGMMREGEPNAVKEVADNVGMNMLMIDAKERFISALRGVTDPEAKRRIIGKTFIEVFEEVAKGLDAKFLLQGTIYPDRIESGLTKNSKVIKTHHNVGGLPERMNLKLVEPLKDLYKDEVRRVGRKLGLTEGIVNRQPFPGPGLAIRVEGEVTPERIAIERKADHIVTSMFEEDGVASGLWQYFAVLTASKRSGVKGDNRAYGSVITIRAVESREAMTASFAKVPYDTLEKAASRITNEIPEVTGVTYEITSKPPATIEWE